MPYVRAEISGPFDSLIKLKVDRKSERLTTGEFRFVADKEESCEREASRLRFRDRRHLEKHKVIFVAGVTGNRHIHHSYFLFIQKLFICNGFARLEQ